MITWQPEPRESNDLQAAAEWIAKGDDWLIVTHERPDGDAIGSALAVAHILQALGKTWSFLVAEPMPARFSFLPLFDAAEVIQSPPTRQFTNIITVDCADERRFTQIVDAIGADAKLVNIDHHQTNPRYGVANFVDEQAAATCELVYHVARALDVPLSTNLAKCLYTGILTDTGGFCLPNTSREVHAIAAELIAAGVQPYDIAEPALEARTRQQMNLLKLALSNLQIAPSGEYATMYVTRAMLDATGADDDDAEGLVGFSRNIDTVEVGLLFRETRDGKVKVSLRAKRKVDVSRLAQQFGGGGHVRAAGCVLDDELQVAMRAVIVEVEKALVEA